MIGTVVYMVIFYGVLLIKPYKMTMFFRVSFAAVVTTILGMFIWAMAANGGAGSMVPPGTKLSNAYVPSSIP